jgi:hypothetical protein
MLKFKINGTLSGRQGYFLYLLLPGNLINFSDVLIDIQFEKWPQANDTHLTDEAIEERLPEFMAVCVPVQAMRFAERVELLDSFDGGHNQR